jgi:phage/plasmid-like protein (TIGR03299 family)
MHNDTAPDPLDAASLRTVPECNADSADNLLQLHGLNWHVEARDVYLADGTVVTGARAIVRSSDDRCLGIVKARYVPIDNLDVFSIFDGFCRAGMLRYARAGQFRGGSIVWMQAEITSRAPIQIGPDNIKRYALAVLSHDGSHAVKFCITPTRVMCLNTLIVALSVADTVVIRHTAGSKIRIRDATRAIEAANQGFDEFEHKANLMLAAPMSDNDMAAFAAEMLPGSKGQDTAVAARTENARRDLVHLFRHGAGHGDIAGTRWAAYNAVAEYTDYQRPTRGEGNRMASAMIGTGAALKRKAWQTLTY